MVIEFRVRVKFRVRMRVLVWSGVAPFALCLCMFCIDPVRIVILVVPVFQLLSACRVVVYFGDGQISNQIPDLQRQYDDQF